MQTGLIDTRAATPIDSLRPLAERIAEEAKAARDFKAPCDQLIVNNGRDLVFENMEGRFPLSARAHQQIATLLGVPAKFYYRLQEQRPDLFDPLINGLLIKDPRNRLIRINRQGVRAILSDRYRRLDNWDLLPHLLETLGGLDTPVEPVSAALTDARLYLKCAFPAIKGEVKVGDVVRSGFMVNNSEVGAGRLALQGFIDRLSCSNGMITTVSFGKTHLGRRIGNGGNGDEDDPYEIFSDETKKADDHAFFLAVRDAVKATADQGRFAKELAKLQEAAGAAVTRKPIEVVEELRTSFELTENEHDSVLQHFLAGNDMSRWGLANAVTRTANDVEDYDRATELQALGGRVIDLVGNQWRRLAEQN